MEKHLNITVYGRVQGVFYRASAQQKARELNLFGFAQNMENGTVYIEVEGSNENLDNFMVWCHQGSIASSVSNIEISEGAIVGFHDFVIL